MLETPFYEVVGVCAVFSRGGSGVNIGRHSFDEAEDVEMDICVYEDDCAVFAVQD